VENQPISHQTLDQRIERVSRMNVNDLFELRSKMVREIKELSGIGDFNEMLSSSKQWYIALEHILTDVGRYPLGETTKSVDSKDQKASGNSLSTFQNEYLQYVKTNMAKKTYDNADRALKKFVGFVGNKPLTKIEPRDLERYKEERKKEVKIATVNIDVRTLKAALQVAVNWECIEKNPFENVKEIREAKKEPRSFSREEFDKLCNAMEGDWLLNIVIFAVVTGLRLGELLNLKWENVDIENKRFTVVSSSDYQVKHGKIRHMPLNEDALSVLRGQKNEDAWVFVDSGGKKFNGNTVSKKFKKYVRRCDLHDELHFHNLRATFASWVAENKGLPYAIQKLLGHSSFKTTERYLAFNDDSLKDAVEKVSIKKKVNSNTLD
jgi:integrase